MKKRSLPSGTRDGDELSSWRPGVAVVDAEPEVDARAAGESMEEDVAEAFGEVVEEIELVGGCSWCVRRVGRGVLGAAGYQALRAEVEINLGPQRESCEEGEVPQKINFMLYWNSRPRTSGFCTKERPN